MTSKVEQREIYNDGGNDRFELTEIKDFLTMVP